MKLSICMMVKNEEKYLDGCLKSIIRLMDKVESELIIVDTGSTDSTIEIAKRYTDRVYFHLWNNDFASMRNISMSYAKGEWVLIIDADEEVEDAAGLVSFLKSKEANDFCAGLVFIRSIAYSGKESGYGYSTATRLFKNNEDLRYENSIHENVKIKGPVINLQTTFVHYGYMYEDTEIAEKKFIRNRDLLLGELKKDPQNIQFKYYLSSAYRKHDDYKDALYHIKRAYETMKLKKYDPKAYAYIYPQLAFCLIENDMYEDAKKICKEGLEIDQDNLDLIYCVARLLFSSRDCDEALPYYNKYLKLHEDKDFHSKVLYGAPRVSTMNRQDEAYLDMAAIYIIKEQYDVAKKCVNKVKTKEYTAKFIAVVNELFIRTKEYELLKKTFDKEHDDDKETFLDVLQSYKGKIPQNEWQEVLNVFSKGKDIYAIYISLIIDFEKQEKDLDPDEEMRRYFTQDNTQNIKLSKMVYKYLLSSKNLNNEEYNLIFEKYAECGLKLINIKHNKIVFEKEEINKLKDEEKFFVYLSLAQENKESDEYVKYLKMAINSYPIMANGIKHLLQSSNVPKNEFEQYQEKIRETISMLIEAGQIENAKAIINEYKKIVKDDSVINKLEGKINSLENK